MNNTDNGEYRLGDIHELPTTAGIYAIVNMVGQCRYVGQAFNIRRRIADHIRDLDAGREHTNADMLLQRAWNDYGRNAFVVKVLEEVENNRDLVQYEVRPDNLALAEHYYINERGEYNKDHRIVRSTFWHLIAQKAWRQPLDDATLLQIKAVRPRPYLVGKRVTWDHAVIVSALSSDDAKREATVQSAQVAHLGKCLSTKRLGANGILKALQNGAIDHRPITIAEAPKT